MDTDMKHSAQALFKSLSKDGTKWLFVVRPDDRWKITRDGEEVAAGEGDRASLESGVKEFVCLTSAVAGPVVAGGKNALHRQIGANGSMSAGEGRSAPTRQGTSLTQGGSTGRRSIPGPAARRNSSTA